MTRRLGLPLSLPLAASFAGHVVLVALLMLLVGRVTPLVLPPHPKPAIEIMLAPPPPPPPLPPPAAVEPPPPPAVETEPPPPPPVIKAEPPPPPAPRSKPVVVRRPPPPRVPPRAPTVAMPPPVPYQAPIPPTQTAAVPRPPPSEPAPTGPVVSAGYRAALGAWLERHKRYPEAARARGETGQAVLRFHVERSGRVLDYAIAKSTGYPELDAAIDQMMRGAVLPPFPAEMTAGDIEVSVTLRFALAR